MRKEAHNLVLPIDFSDFKDVQLVVETLQSFVKRKVPIRFGLVPQTKSTAASDQAKVVYHLFDAYGLSSTLGYLEKMLARQGKKMSAPIQSVFDQSVKDRKLRRDHPVVTLQQLLEDETKDVRLASAYRYLQRLGAIGAAPPLFANGVPIQRTDDWLQEMSSRISTDSRAIQKAVFEEALTDESYLPELFLTGSSPRRNPIIVPENEADIRHLDLADVALLADGALGSVQSIRANQDTIESELGHMFVVTDLDSAAGKQFVAQAIAFRKEHDNVELFIVHNPTPVAVEATLSVGLHKALIRDTSIDIENLQEVVQKEATQYQQSDVLDARSYWESTTAFLQTAGFQPGESGVVLNGRIVGPVPAAMNFEIEDFETLFAYERRKRLMPAAAAIKDLGLAEKINSPLTFARSSNLIALSSSSDVPEGVFEATPPARTNIHTKWASEHTAIVTGNLETASIQVVASIDPASETAQRWVPILKVLSELGGVHMSLFLNPRDRLDELPIKRFYRHVLESKPTFDENGRVSALGAHFGGLPADALLTMAMDVPPSWLVAPKISIHDLDNIKLSSVKNGDINAIYGLQHILIEGHSTDVTLGSAPRGAQLILSTEKEPHFTDTIIMSNLGYFQFKATPGFYNLALQRGRSEEIFQIDSAGAQGYNPQAGDESTVIALTSFRGTTLFPRLSRRPDMEEEDVLESAKTAVEAIGLRTDALLSKVGLGSVKASDYLTKAQKLGNNMFSGKSANVEAVPHADINIFSVASGHLYERMLNIMMVSVMKHTSHTVKFWFIEQFLSPSFKAFLPTLAEEYGFRYEMVTYKWPHWLRGQKEKQREIWGYKILFLDVLFPLDLEKVIFVDADQIVRTDMYELVQHDLEGAPYGFTPMGDSRTEMEGFRFWKQGYWKNFLRGLPYHISALYVVDLVRFRQIAAGDRLRQQYHQLSADPASLSNLDQDLPNHMQHVLPIHSLPEEWLWCETWCSDESLSKARTIDLCNNPQTKEPKLDRARRQVPEWTVYDNEIGDLAKRTTGIDGPAPIAGSAADPGIQAEMQRQEAEALKKEREGKHDEL